MPPAKRLRKIYARVFEPRAARELGGVFRLGREAMHRSVRDLATQLEYEYGYLSSLELGRKLRVAPERYADLAHALHMPEALLDGLIMKARITSALEAVGLSEKAIEHVWRGVEERLRVNGYDIDTDVLRWTQALHEQYWAGHH